MILLRKVVRAMWENKKAYLSCIILISVGIMMYTAFGILVGRMEDAKETYYAEYRLADVFANVTAMPVSALERISAIEGVKEVSGRHTYDARVIMPDNDKVITLKLISSEKGEDDRINGYAITGSDFYYSNDLIVGEAFMTAHGLKPGDSLRILAEGREVEFNISGSAAGPEFVYTIRNAEEMLPDPETYSIAYVQREMLDSITGRYGFVNDVSLILKPGTDFDSIKAELEDELGQYELSQLIERKDQLSNFMLESEIKGQRSMVSSVPIMFMLMSAVILYLMLKRVIEQERQQIGTLKAFGYTDGQILRHYLCYGALAGFCGGALGVGLGYLLAGPMISMMLSYFRLPMKTGGYPISFFFTGILLGVGSGIIGVYAGAKGVLRLNPAEAMRPQAPPPVKGTAAIPFFYRFLNTRGYMAMRSMLRSKARSIFTAAGIMFSFGILAFMGSFGSMIDDMMLNLISKVQIYDLKITLAEPQNLNSAKESVFNLPGVQNAEGLMEIPAEASNGHRKEGIVLTGIEDNSKLYRIYDNNLRAQVPLPQGGVLLSSVTARDLEAEKGDYLILSNPQWPEDKKVYVADIVEMSLGGNAYANMDFVAELAEVPPLATAVLTKTENAEEIKDILLEGKNVSLIEDKAMTLKTYNELLGSYDAMIALMQVGGALIAFAIIYNASTISLSERKREYATLRVMGMETAEVKEILAFEYWFLTIIGMGLGIPCTMALKEAMSAAIDIHMFTFPTYTPTSAYILAVAGCSAAVLMSNRSAAKQIARFDMVEVLKERE